MKTHKMINEIMMQLFAPEYRRLTSWTDRICRDNREAYNDPELVGFVYEGMVYKPSNVDLGMHQIKRRGLHSEVVPSMDAYLKDLKLLKQDQAYVRQSLFKLLDPCQNMQDVRDALPNCLCDTLPELRDLTRGRQEAYTIVNDARSMRQYQKILPRIEMYAAARLMY